MDTRRHYRDLIMEHGILKDISRPPWAIPESSDRDAPQLLIGAATVVEAAYEALETAPQNPQ
eukprot:597906-Alexandrium_andersonii.AAC.1